MNIVILAAGKGTRMKSNRPKVLHSLGGMSMIERVVQTSRHLGGQRLILVVGHQAEQVRQVFQGQSDLVFVSQVEQLGTGHAVKMAVSSLDPDVPTLVLYGDVPLIQLDSLIRLKEIASSGKFGLMTLDLPDPTSYGRIKRNETGEVVGIVEQKDANEHELKITEVNTGILCSPTPFLIDSLARLNCNNSQKEYYLTDIVGMAHQSGMSIETCQPNYPWEAAGINSRVQQAALERQWQLHQAEQLMEQGVQMADPSRLDVRGKLVCGHDVTIDVNVVCEGVVEIGDGSSIGANCFLRNVSLGVGTRVEPFSHLDGATVGAGAVIGPFARLRPGARLSDEVHVGNFVEIKNATVDRQSKINHLSYIGDAKVGKRVNIGAGTITCNYDGVNKHLTEIGDDVFVGSDTQLVAPVRVEDGATLGAGTTLTKNAPANSLTVSRARQVTIDGWKRPVKKAPNNKQN